MRALAADFSQNVEQYFVRGSSVLNSR